MILNVTNMSGNNKDCGNPSKKKAGPHDARSRLRANVKFGVSQCIKVSMQTLSSTSELREKLMQKLVSAKTTQQREKMNGLLALLNELTAQYELTAQARDGREYTTAILPFEYALELYLGYQTGYVPNTATQDTKIQFTETLLNPNTGLFVSIIRLSSLGKSYIVLRPPDGNMEPALDFILEELNNKPEEKTRFDLNSETVQSILSTMDSEWDKKVACVLLGVNR